MGRVPVNIAWSLVTAGRYDLQRIRRRPTISILNELNDLSVKGRERLKAFLKKLIFNFKVIM